MIFNLTIPATYTATRQMHFYLIDMSDLALITFWNTLQAVSVFPFYTEKKTLLSVTQLSSKRRQLNFQRQTLAQCSVPVATTGQTPFLVHLCARWSIRCAMQLKVHNWWNAASSCVPRFILTGPELTHLLHSSHICFALNASHRHLNTQPEFCIKFQMSLWSRYRVWTRRWSYTAPGVSCRNIVLLPFIDPVTKIAIGQMWSILVFNCSISH